ncbi:MAG TPA: hypothetical protein VNE62_06015 [Actinomycetota bacterium]|nr:hypothetical protein [Actinomycetota bacterium]
MDRDNEPQPQSQQNPGSGSSPSEGAPAPASYESAPTPEAGPPGSYPGTTGDPVDVGDSPAYDLPAPRSSPYAIASMVVGLVALSRGGNILAMAQLFGRQLDPVTLVVNLLEVLIVPVVPGVLAVWLSWRADDEIQMSQGRLGGRGFSQAGRVLGFAVLIALLLGLALTLVGSPDASVRLQ